ncbi:MAG: electron transport complex subunit RsxC [Pseudomonadota bacterium]|nr:electron transport complex subunit RsxC [Pseudomonadota bacterium]
MFGFGKIRGGVHPETHKDLTAGRSILQQLPLPRQLHMPLSQHAGVAATPLVGVGDRVLKGQLIARAAGSMSANVHASSSGVVSAIGPIVAPHPSGLPATAITIDTDGEDRWVTLEPITDPFSMDPDTLAARVEAAGIVGMGGAIFPAAVKLRQGRRFEIQTLIVNGSECEPYLTCDDHLMQERAEAVVDGARLVRHIIEAYRVVIAVEDNKPDAFAALTKAAAPHGMVEVMTVPTQYPMGSAKQLIQAVTGREVPAGQRSNDIGVLVHNVGTVFAIQQALRYGRPLISRVVTVAGGCVQSPHNVEALLGTPLRELIAACDGLKGSPARLLMGGPMMGQIVPALDTPVIKGCTGLLALTQREVNAHAPAPCIRCGRCVDACPMGLVPLEMARHSGVDDFEHAQEYGLRDCILCGSCAYVCPSHIPLVQYFEYAKGELKERKQSEQKQEYTKRLISERAARLEQEAAAKAAAKAAKKKKARKSRSRESAES